MKPAEVRGLEDTDLLEHIKNTRRDLFGRRFQLATGELEDTAGIGSMKKDLARALTIARERGLDTTKA